jgi:hypothetical protein
VDTAPKTSGCILGGTQTLFCSLRRVWRGTGKAEDAKTPGAGIIPKLCPRKCVVEMESGSHRPIGVREGWSCVLRQTELSRREVALEGKIAVERDRRFVRVLTGEIRVSSSKDKHFDLPLKYLSESEQFRFGVAFQLALAMVTGLRFVVIDGADILDRDRRKMLTGLLLNSKLDQAIVLATSEEAPPSIVPEGVKFLSLVEKMKRDESRESEAA